MTFCVLTQGQRLAKLCREKSSLGEEDILHLENILANMQHFADLAGADIFIDVATKDPDAAVVVAEAKPSTSPSMYQGSVVGEYAQRCNEPAVFKTFEDGEPALNVQGMSQERVPIAQTVTPIRNSEDKIIAVLIMERDNSFQVRQERTMELLSQTTQKLTDTLLNLASVGEVLPSMIHDALFIVDVHGRISFVNHAANKLLHSFDDSINPVGMTVERLTIQMAGLQLVFNSELSSGEVQIQGHILMVRSLPILEGTEVQGKVYLLSDITELRKKERQLIAKSTVIKEIHHRVKNNLQTIASLMRLQMRRVKNQETQDAFQESINRIRCIALVHEIFSRETPEVIELRECITRIGQILLENMLLPEQQIEFQLLGEDIYIPSNQATPTAIVVNEILTNSLKYAFVGNVPGKITVWLEGGQDEVKIIIRDNGSGFPSGFDPEVSANLGLQITQALVTESLAGDMFMYNDGGAVVEIKFPKWEAER